MKSSFETVSPGEAVKLTVLVTLRSQGWQNGKTCCFHRPCKKRGDDRKDATECLLDSYSLLVLWYAPCRHTPQKGCAEGCSEEYTEARLRFVPGSV